MGLEILSGISKRSGGIGKIKDSTKLTIERILTAYLDFAHDIIASYDLRNKFRIINIQFI